MPAWPNPRVWETLNVVTDWIASSRESQEAFQILAISAWKNKTFPGGLQGNARGWFRRWGREGGGREGKRRREGMLSFSKAVLDMLWEPSKERAVINYYRDTGRRKERGSFFFFFGKVFRWKKSLVRRRRQFSCFLPRRCFLPCCCFLPNSLLFIFFLLLFSSPSPLFSLLLFSGKKNG